MHPGVVNTQLINGMQAANWFFNLVSVPGRWMIKTPFHGAQTPIFCALEDSLGAEESGAYFSDCRRQRSSANAMNVGDQERLWNVSVELTDLKS